MGDAVYLEAVDDAVAAALAHDPELVFYVAGADPLRDDRLGRLAVSRKGLADRDRRIFTALGAERVPVAVVMGGGYARDVADTVAVHFATVQAALALRERYASARSTSR